MSCLSGSESPRNAAHSLRAPSPGLAEAVKQTVSYGGCSISPRSSSSYHRIEMDMDDLASERGSNVSSTASAATRKFTCQFDPSVKNGRLLVLRFDTKGVGVFLEMSRADLLHLAQQAAQPKFEESDEPEVQSDAPPNIPPNVRLGKRPSIRRAMMGGSLGRAGPDGFCVNSSFAVQRVHARDIRKLDVAFSVSNEPSIVIRKQAILISADPLRAIILRDSCLVFVPDGADSLLTILQNKFRETTCQEFGVAYEFKALEALLATMCKYFDTDYENTAPIVSAALDNLASGKIHMGELETLREFKNSINEFESQVDRVRRVLMDLLDHEESLRLLYLTKLHDNPALLQDLWSFDSEEAEVLIENYLQDIFSTRTKAGLLLYRIQNTESLVTLKLDSMRNYLLGVDLIFSLVVISLSVGTFVTGIFGMNLDSHLQERAGWFWGVVTFTVVAFLGLTSFGIIYFRRQGVLLGRTVKQPRKLA